MHWLAKCGTDFASLYDTKNKEGVVRLPAERRLVLDLLGLKEQLPKESPEKATAACRTNLPSCGATLAICSPTCSRRRWRGPNYESPCVVMEEQPPPPRGELAEHHVVGRGDTMLVAHGQPERHVVSLHTWMCALPIGIMKLPRQRTT